MLLASPRAFRVEPIRWRREFNRELVRMMLHELKKANADAVSLCARMGKQLCNGPGELDSETCVKFSKWCHMGGVYTKAQRIARAISCLLYGDIIRRMDGE